MILFGGQGSQSYPYQSNDTWVLRNADGTGGPAQWQQLTTIGAPPVRRHAGGAYDSRTNRLIVYGGDGAGSCPCPFLNDIWVLTNANGLETNPPTWTQLNPIGTQPPARSSATFAYDSVNNRAIVYGGEGPGTLADTWVLTNANGTGGAPAWVQLSVAGVSPQRTRGSSAYDPATNRLIAYGGDRLHYPATVDDAWVLTNANGLGGAPAWNRLITSGGPPVPRAYPSTAYDTALNRLIVFGGDGPNTLNDTWVLANASGAGGGPLKIDQVLPNRGGNAGSVTVQIIGGGFQTGAIVRLTGIGPDLIGSNTVVTNTAHLTTTLNLTGAVLGQRTVVYHKS